MLTRGTIASASRLWQSTTVSMRSERWFFTTRWRSLIAELAEPLLTSITPK